VLARCTARALVSLHHELNGCKMHASTYLQSFQLITNGLEPPVDVVT
jgi:hypothetical protein